MQISNVMKIATYFSIQVKGEATEEINMGKNASTNHICSILCKFYLVFSKLNESFR